MLILILFGVSNVYTRTKDTWLFSLGLYRLMVWFSLLHPLDLRCNECTEHQHNKGGKQ